MVNLQNVKQGGGSGEMELLGFGYRHTVENNRVRWWGGAYKAVVVVGGTFVKHKGGRWLGPKNLKLTCWGSILGMQSKNTVGGNGEGGCRGNVLAVTVAWWQVCEM